MAGSSSIEVGRTNDVTQKRLTLLIYGEPKIGKTTLCATIGVSDETRLCYINADEGHLALRKHGFVCVKAKGEDAPTEIFHYIKKNEKSFDWVVVDGLDNIADEMLMDEKARENKQAKPNKWAPFDRMADRMIAWMKAMRDIKPNLLLITHISKEKDDTGRITYSPSFPGVKAWEKLPELFDEIGVMRAVQRPDENGNYRMKRMIQFSIEADDRFLCGDRSGALEPLEEPNLKNIFAKIHDAVAETPTAKKKGAA